MLKYSLSTWQNETGTFMFNLDCPFLGKWYVIPRLLKMSLADWITWLSNNGAQFKRIYRECADGELMILSYWKKEDENKFNIFIKKLKERLKKVECVG